MINLNNSLGLATAAISCSPPSHAINTAIVDTGASDHYFTPGAPLLHVNTAAPSTTIRTATGEAKSSTATAVLTIPSIPTLAARTGHIIPGFTNNLISLGKLCDADCTAYLDKTSLHVTDKNGNKVFHGTREPTGARLWRVNITPPTIAPTKAPAAHQAPPLISNDLGLPPPPTGPTLPVPPTATTCPVATRATTMHVRAYDLPSIPALITYLHASAGYPVKSTWLQAIKRGAYATWPGLSAALVARYCPDAPETTKGHMAQPRQHIRSTQPPQIRVPAPPSRHTVELHELPANHLFTDDTGRFHPRSRSGAQYIMVALHTGTNAILVQPFATKNDTHRIPAYQAIHDRLCSVGHAPTMHIMDNEASAAFQRTIRANGCDLQLVPPHVHRRNAAERAIRTFKDHFLSVLPGTAATYPTDRWDLLLPQAELTLNLLRPAPAGATSAWEALSTSTQPRSHLQAVPSKSMQNPHSAAHGTTGRRMGFTSDRRSATTVATVSSLRHRKQSSSATPSSSGHTTCRHRPPPWQTKSSMHYTPSAQPWDAQTTHRVTTN